MALFDINTLAQNAGLNRQELESLYKITVANVYDIKPELKHDRWVVPHVQEATKGYRSQYTLPTLVDTGQTYNVHVQNITTAQIRTGQITSTTPQLTFANGLDAEIQCIPTRAFSKAFPLFLENYQSYMIINNVSSVPEGAMQFLQEMYYQGIVSQEGLINLYMDADILRDLIGQAQGGTGYVVTSQNNTATPTVSTQYFGFDTAILNQFPNALNIDTISQIEQIFVTNRLTKRGWRIKHFVNRPVFNAFYAELVKSPNPAGISWQTRFSSPEEFKKYQTYPAGSANQGYNTISVGEFTDIVLLPANLDIFGYNQVVPGFQLNTMLAPSYAGYQELITPLEQNLGMNQPIHIMKDFRMGAKTQYGSYFVTETVPTNGNFLLSKEIIYGARTALKVPARFNYAGVIPLSANATVVGIDYTSQMTTLIANALALYQNDLINNISNVQTRTAEEVADTIAPANRFAPSKIIA